VVQLREEGSLLDKIQNWSGEGAAGGVAQDDAGDETMDEICGRLEQVAVDIAACGADKAESRVCGHSIHTNSKPSTLNPKP
jgi:hypothetical protein